MVEAVLKKIANIIIKIMIGMDYKTGIDYDIIHACICCMQKTVSKILIFLLIISIFIM